MGYFKDLSIDEKNQKKEQKDFTKYYVKPHEKISKKVLENDLSRVLKDAKIMYNLCFVKYGIHSGALAIAHQQIDSKNPLRFFITREKEIIINPTIVRHTNHTVDSKEGCLSFPDNIPIIVQRYNKCEVNYQTIEGNGEKLINKECKLSGLKARIFQHEINHLDCIYIFNIK